MREILGLEEEKGGILRNSRRDTHCVLDIPLFSAIGNEFIPLQSQGLDLFGVESIFFGQSVIQ